MEANELIKRAEDLSARCDKTNTITNSLFLTPAEQYGLHNWITRFPQPCKMIFHGGKEDCERKIAFFLPYYVDEEDFDVSEYISVIKCHAGFGMPGHRDYMGAVLGLGIKREWVGDIWVIESDAYVFCQPSVESHILSSLEKVGRFGIKTSKISLEEVPIPQKVSVKESFSVMSLRLDGVLAGMFNISRTEAARLITAGRASLNYTETLKTDANVKVGDIISLRGYGKGRITELGGMTRRGRQVVNAELLK